MPEEEAIGAAGAPATVTSLARDLARLGVRRGDILLTHVALSRLGWISGGAEGVIRAVLAVLGPEGTLVMPAHSSQVTDPANWRAPPVPADWIATIRASMPAWDADLTPTRGMGATADMLRRWPGVRRSLHPAASFAGLGPAAAGILANQPLEDPLGEGGPLGALYRGGAKVLLLGVGLDRCTALHLAERMTWPAAPRIAEGAPLLVAGRRKWVAYRTPDLIDSGLFAELGPDLRDRGIMREGALGAGRAAVMAIPALVDHARAVWIGRPWPG